MSRGVSLDRSTRCLWNKRSRSTPLAAYLSFVEEEKDSIETSKLADFVVLDLDPFSIPLEEIGAIGINRMLFDGRTV